jgi:glycosyltransferase
MLRIFKKYNFTSEYLNKVIVKMRLGGVTNKSLSSIIRQNVEILNAWKHNRLKPPLLLMPFRLFKRLLQFIK